MYQIIKRLFDLLFSLVIIAVLIPIFIVLFPWLRFTGEGYIFYYQKRVGYKQKPFDIIKFATMLKDSPNLGTGLVTLRNDPRVTPAGKFLRMTKLNELPQIFNVFKGDMSFVGPRPLVGKTFEHYPLHIKDQICNSVPGITGIGSIVFRDEEKLLSEQKGDPGEYMNNVIMPYKGELEMWYLKHKSLWVDFVILFLTGWVILFPSSQLVYTVFKDLPKGLGKG
ncbi:MAG: sugar transferase [Bacteroidia bacterium]|jgi:lipopolysaccharide/colanic/teichoic acid biosynthesis glycosyltransferase